MRLYPKRLNNLAELKREKMLLKEQREQTDLHHLFTSDGMGAEAGEDEGVGAGGGLLGMALSLLGSESLFGAAIKHLPSIFSLFSKKETKQQANKKSKAATEDEKHTSLVMKVVKEVGLGYLKWKAIELGFKGVKKLVNFRKQKHEA